MYLLKLFFFILFFWKNNALRDTFNKKNFQLEKNLRKELRPDNDDYAEWSRDGAPASSTPRSYGYFNWTDIKHKISTTREYKNVLTSHQTSTEYSATTSATTLRGGRSDRHREDVRLTIIDNIKRRVNEALVSKEVHSNSDIVPQRRARGGADGYEVNARNRNDADTSSGAYRPTLRSLWLDVQHLLEKSKVDPYRMRLLSHNNNALKQIAPKRAEQVVNSKEKDDKKKAKKNKMKKFQKFIQKNKGLLREFINSKKNKMPAQSVSSAPSVPRVTPPSRYSDKLSEQELNSVLQQAMQAYKHKQLKELPNPAVLDMFPAKGGRIHAKRVKGRLCHRHVLIPEGPKYNSEGQVYLQPHYAAHIAHEYNATDQPTFLLPRCCNCCRKSVLGCQ